MNNFSRNRLLLALPSRNLRRLLPDVEHIHCQGEQILMEADGPLDHVYFPVNGVISVLAVYADGSAIEMATIGREGCTGAQAIFGGRISSMRFFVQIPGSAVNLMGASCECYQLVRQRITYHLPKYT